MDVTLQMPTNILDHEMTMRWRQIVPWLERWNSRTEGAGVPGDRASAAPALGCSYQTSLVRERTFILLKLPLRGALDAAKLIQTHATLYTRSLHAARGALKNCVLQFCSLCPKRQSCPLRLPVQFRMRNPS